MTTKADFTEEEWATLVRAPMVAGAAISLADPGGPIEVLKETSAVVKVVTGSAGEDHPDLVGEVAREVRALAEQLGRRAILSSFTQFYGADPGAS